MKHTTPQIVLIGTGNTIRSDDGIAYFICKEIEKRKIPGVTTLTVQQLSSDMITELLPYDHIIVVDASIAHDDVAFYPLQQDETKITSSSHHLSVGMLDLLARRLYGKQLSLFMCAVKGEDFSLGEQFSETATTNAGKAIEILTQWINKYRQTPNLKWLPSH